MKPKKKSDLQTISLFLVLGLMTWAFVILIRLVLYAPAISLVESATR